MSQRFYFDLRSSQTGIVDEEGILTSDIDEAIKEALEALREMRASGELDECGDGWRLVIRDDKGVTRKTISIW